MCRLFAFILTFTILITANADQLDDVEPFYAPLAGSGILSCGQFIAFNSIENHPNQIGIAEWVRGFASAYAMRSSFGKKFKRTIDGNISSIPDHPTVLLFLKNHCNKYPLDKVSDGAITLIKELGGQIDWKNDR